MVEVSIETPEYDLTVLRIRFRQPDAEDLYQRRARPPHPSNGSTMRDLGFRLGASYFLEAVAVLRQMVERSVRGARPPGHDLDSIPDVAISSISRAGLVLSAWAESTSTVLRDAEMQALIAPAPDPAGFTSSELAAKVARLVKDERYSPSD